MEASAEGSQEGQAGPTSRLTRAAQRIAAAAPHIETAAAVAVALWISRSFWLPGRYVVAFDTIAYSAPNFDVTMDAWRDARLPLWNEYVFGGVTHLGNPQAGALYPPKVIGLLVDANRAMGLLVAGHLVLLAVGMVLLVRRLGCRPPAGFVAAVAMCASGAVITRTVQFEQILVLSWAPLLLLGVTAVLTADVRPWAALAGTAAVTAMVLLAGHPQIVYQLVFVALVWSAALLVMRRTWLRLGELVLAVVVGAAVAAPQLVAAIAATRDSSLGFGRSLTELESPVLSAQPHHLVQILLGSVRHVDEAAFAGGFESIGHVGVAAALLAVTGIGVALRDRARAPLAIALAVLAVIGVVWALGPRTPLFTFAYDWIVGFDLARASGRWLDATALAVAVGAAWGVDALREAVGPTRFAIPAAIGAALLGLALVLGATGASELPDRWTVAAWVVVAAIVVAALVLPPRRSWIALPTAAVVTIVVVELLALARYSSIDSTTTSTAFDDRPAGVAAELAERAGLTVAFTNDEFADIGYLVAGFRPNTNVLAEVRSLDGYDGGVQVTDRFVALESALAPDVDPTLPLRNHLPSTWEPRDAAALGVRWALIDSRRDVATQLPGWRRTELVGGDPGGVMEVWENPAWLGDAIGRRSGGTDVALGVQRRSPTELVVTTDEDEPMRVVVHRQIAPGWTVRVDGERADIVDADGFFMAVDVTPGAHTLVFEYRPRWVRPSLALSAAGLLGLGAMVAAAATGRARPGDLKSAGYRADRAVQPDER